MVTWTRRGFSGTASLLAALSAGVGTGLFAASAAADDLAEGPPSDLLDIDDAWVADISQPTGMGFLPDGRLVITRRTGQVMVRTVEGELVEAGSITVSTSFGEKGLLNVIAHPEYATNNLIYLYYTGVGGGQDDNRVSTFELSEDNVLDVDSEIPIMEGVAAPLNHDGGGLAIDGNYLFIGTGDSGSNSNAEPDQMIVRNYFSTCLTNLNGKVLRLNLDGSIPADNPLVGLQVQDCSGVGDDPTASNSMVAPREEIFAWGFRNAFRVWSDPKSHNLWVGHVGEVTYEMISTVPPTGNVHLGWPFREGNEGQPPARCQDVVPNVGDCRDSAYRCEASSGNPGSADYNPDVPDDCDSITGGLILTGCEWPEGLEGLYVFGDYESERLWTLEVNEARDNAVAERVDFGSLQGGGPVAFLEHEGALYVAAYSGSGGHISKITPKMSDASCAGEEPDPPDMPTDDGGGTDEPGMTDDTSAPPVTDEGTEPGGETDVPPGETDDGPTMPPGMTDETDPPGPTPTDDTPPPVGMPSGSGSDTPTPTPTQSATPTASGMMTGTPPGGEMGGAAAGAPPDDAAGGAGNVTDDVDDAEESGCGCRVIGEQTGNGTGALGVAALGLGLALLRRRNSQRA